MYPTPLRDDLFVLAHDDAGRSHVHAPTLGVGLAGAVLIELAFAGRIALSWSRVVVPDRRPTGDNINDRTLGTILHAGTARGLQAWLGDLSQDEYDRVQGALVADGVLRRTTVRRLGVMPVTRYRLVDPDTKTRVRARLRYAVTGVEASDPPTAALCSLVRVLRLEGHLHLDRPTGEVLARLDYIARGQHEVIRAIVAAVDDVIAAGAVSVYR